MKSLLPLRAVVLSKETKKNKALREGCFIYAA